MNSQNLQIISLSILSALCIIGLIFLYSISVTPPELLVGFSGAIVAALLNEVSQDNALNRAERVARSSAIEIVES